MRQHLAFQQFVPARESWWATTDPAQFYEKAKAELPRIQQGRGAVLVGQVHNESTTRYLDRMTKR